MGIRVALHHKTIYQYDRLVTLSPQVIRLRPAPHSRTPVTSYSLRIEPSQHFINWQQDPQGNFLARVVFPNPTTAFSLEVDLVAEMTVLNPFDFFLEPHAEHIPFVYDELQRRELAPFLEVGPAGPRLQAFLADDSPRAGTDDQFPGGPQSARCRATCATSSAWSRACRRARTRWGWPADRAATRRGCSSRRCATSGWPLASSPAT